jgi:plasmid stability protein
MSSVTPTSVRLAPSLHERLVRRAAADRRSVSETIRALLTQALTAEAEAAETDVDPEEIERLADLAREYLP